MNKIQLFFDEENQLLSALKEVDNALALSREGLLKNEELKQIESRSIKRAEENINKESLVYRKFDRFIKKSRWKSAYPPVYVDFRYTNEILGELRAILAESIEEITEKSDTKDQVFIDKGKPFDGRVLIRQILSTAKKTIEIQDNYPSVEGDDQSILPIVQPYIEQNNQLKVRILAEKISASFLSDIRLFAEQYPGKIELRKHKNSHGRFIIIDDTEVYTSGSSLKDLGKKADFLTKLTDQTAIDKTIKEFNIWFKQATDPLQDKYTITKTNITFEIIEDKFVHWGNQATGFNQVWGFGLWLRINNFKNNKPDYVKVQLKSNTSEGVWESQHFIFNETKEERDQPDKPFEVAPNKIVEIAVVLSQDYPAHSRTNTQKVSKPDLDTDTVILIVSTESGVRQEIKIKPSLVANS
jgi:hypothetical protein